MTDNASSRARQDIQKCTPNAGGEGGGRGGEKGLCGKEWAHFFASQTGKGKPLGQLGTMLLLGSVDPPRPPGRNFRTLTFKMSRHDVQYE